MKVESICVFSIGSKEETMGRIRRSPNSTRRAAGNTVCHVWQWSLYDSMDG